MFASGIVGRDLRWRSGRILRFHSSWIYTSARLRRTIEERIPRRTFVHGPRRAIDTGVWKGHAYDDIPAITIVAQNPAPRQVRLMRMYAMEALMDHMCPQSPEARSRRETWSIAGRLSMKRCKGHFSSPSHFALTVTVALDHRTARIPQVPVGPLLPQHGNECGQQ